MATGTVSFQQHRLPNGLTIIAEVDRNAHTAAAGFFVKTGARDESTPLMGVSHFLEHMMFKGTETISADELNRRFDEIGARNNAFTSNEMTCFYAHVLPEYLESGMDMLGQMMRPALRQADFDMEKGVILEEIAMYKDNPFWVLYEATLEKHFGTHPLSHRVLGTDDSIKAMKRDEMMAYFENRYSANNTIVALAGNMDFDKVGRQIEALCGRWQSTSIGRDNADPPIAGGELVIKSEKVNRAYMLGLCRAPAMADQRRYAAALLAQIVGAPDNSRFHWSLIETGLAEDAQASFDPHDGFGEFFVYASGDPERADEIWAEIEKQLDGLVASLSQEDLDRLLNKLATGATIGGERPHDRMHRLGRQWTYLGKYSTLEEELAKIRAVTLDDLRATAAAFPIKPCTTGRLIPA
ncbi:MAG TPA: pitrilysin family protein [Phycisphaerales bacterium]|nr:pitrilysin family protein [Phycisphaerales bacterium]